MHIGFITPEYPTAERPEGGLANYTRRVALGMVERGHTVSIFVLYDGSPNLDAADEVAGLNIKWIQRSAIPWYTRFVAVLRPFSSLLEHHKSALKLAGVLWRHHSHEPIDVIVTPNYYAPGDALRKNGRIPVVCRVCWYPSWCRVASLGGRSFVDYLWDWLDFRQIRDADQVFAPSAFLADVYKQYEGLNVDLVRTPVQPHAEIVEDVSWWKSHLEGKTYLLYFGNLSGIKGVDLLAEAMPPILQSHPDLHIVLLGRDCGLPDGSEFAGFLSKAFGEYADRLLISEALPKSQLWPVIRAAYGVVLPSRVDNYPNTCLESLSLGRPVICSDRSSLDEMVTHQSNGMLFRNGDAASLQKTLEAYLQLPEQSRAEMSCEAEKSAAVFVNEDRVGQLEEFLKSTVAAYTPEKKA